MTSDRIPAPTESATLSLGYSSLKPEQRDVVMEFVLGSDVFAILPTGYGKSLYSACLPRVYNCLLDATSSIVVVTPLTDNERSGAFINKNMVHVFRAHFQIIIAFHLHRY